MTDQHAPQSAIPCPATNGVHRCTFQYIHRCSCGEEWDA